MSSIVKSSSCPDPNIEKSNLSGFFLTRRATHRERYPESPDFVIRKNPNLLYYCLLIAKQRFGAFPELTKSE